MLSRLVCTPLLATVVDAIAAVDAATDVELDGDYLIRRKLYNKHIIAANLPDLDAVELDDVDVELLLWADNDAASIVMARTKFISIILDS